MPDLLAWYWTAQPYGNVIMRGTEDRYWFFSCDPRYALNAWGRGLRFRCSPPWWEPLLPYQAQAYASVFGVPGAAVLDEEARMTALWELMLERAALEPPPRLAAQPADSLRTHRAHVETPEDVLRLMGVTP